METAKLKKFAQAARTDLLKQVAAKLALVLTPDSAARREQPRAIRELEQQIGAGSRDQVVERVAYTWFNRFIALRFMDLNGYTRIRVVSPTDESQVQPEILAEAKMGHIDEERVPERTREQIRALLGGTAPAHDPQQEAYRLLLVAECNSFHRIMPFLFERIADYTELLMPDDLLSANSIIAAVREALTPDACRDVEVLGWLYQFYIAEKKDEVMARKRAVPTEDIPAVTQLFTPHWIVRYLVENSLGRLWLLNRPSSRLREQMPYYIEGEPETDFLEITRPEDIRVLDPAVGSGHMLTYAFDLLTSIYEEEGHAPAEVPGLILQHNLYGLEICPRAAQLAGLALVLKARAKSRRFFQPERFVQPRIIELQNITFAEGELDDYFNAIEINPSSFIPNTSSFPKLLHQFEEAKTFGSLIQPCLDEPAIDFARGAIKEKDVDDQLFVHDTHLKVMRVLEQAEALTQRYHVVVANPPYMGSGAMNLSIRNHLSSTIKEGKADLYAAFILRNLVFLKAEGLCGMITIPNWMFLQSFSDLRRIVLSNGRIDSMSHNGRGIWGGDFGSCAFVVAKSANHKRKGLFKRLFKKPGEIQSNAELELNFHNSGEFPTYFRSSSDFHKLPRQLIAYWLSEKSLELLSGPTIENLGTAKRGLQPGDVERFVKVWWELFPQDVELQASSRAEASSSTRRWFKFDSGGAFRRWYGNNVLVVDWENNGRRIKNGHNPIVPSEHLYFEPGFVWSRITASVPSLRLHDGGVINGDVSPCFFPTEFRFGILGLLNSICASHFLTAISPTLTFLVSDVLKVPRCVIPSVADEICKEAVSLARADWNNYETSWDFRDHPLLRPELEGATLEASWRNWEAHCTAAIRRMQELETENNRIFIAAYGLEDELSPEVPEEQITLARAEVRRDMADFLSYAVGCMFGRYSLDKPGLILANQGETIEDYYQILTAKDAKDAKEENHFRDFRAFRGSISSPADSEELTAKGAKDAKEENHFRDFRAFRGSISSPADSEELTAKDAKDTKEENHFRDFRAFRGSISFPADENNVIPVLDGDWFPDDITERCRHFLRVTFGEAQYAENLAFIEAALGKDLRKYFLKDFYSDHVKRYKKRPIYWLFSSPKGTFNALIYLHRYRPDTVSVVLQYLRDFRQKLAARLDHLQQVGISTSASQAEKTRANKAIDAIKKQLLELEDYERETLYPLATEQIALDLDDGVKVNYLKLGPALKKIPGLEAKGED